MQRALLAALVFAAPLDAAPPGDATETALDTCLTGPTGVSTAGMTDCDGTALRSYDRRLNAAYAKLIRSLPVKPRAALQASQRRWLAFRDAELAAQSAIYATRQGTMYVPMQASSAATLTGDRAKELEGYVRVIGIQGP